MYKDTVTIFNRYVDSFDNTIWYPHVISDANFISDKAVITSKYGEVSGDKAVINVKYHIVDGTVMVGNKPYFSPKEWERQTNDQLPNSITFTSGNNFDFFILGDYGSEEPIIDEDGRFFSNMQEEYDDVYAITSATKYSIIPHFEITGK